MNRKFHSANNSSDLLICDGDRSYAMDGSARGGIQLGILEAFAGLIKRKKL